MINEVNFIIKRRFDFLIYKEKNIKCVDVSSVIKNLMDYQKIEA